MTLDDLDIDDEDDRKLIFQAAKKKFDAAQKEYLKKNATVDVLRKFEVAEEAMKPLLQSGLSGLNEQELEVVLKGRLHQAVIHSTIETEQPGCWEKVKKLVEDVLQFDFRNAHARWLRGLALLHTAQRRQDAQEEMRRAIEQARVQGRTPEVKQWEEDFKRCFDPVEVQARKAEVSSSAAAQSSGPIIEEIEEIEEPPLKEDQAQKKKAASQDPALQKGFFNKSVAASNKKKPSGTPDADGDAKKSTSPNANSFDVAEVEAVLSADLKACLAPALQEQWQEAKSAINSLCTAVSDVKEDIRTNRAQQKTINEHHKNLLFQAEKLRESAEQSLKDRQEASKKALDQLRDVTKNVTDLKEKFQSKMGSRTALELQNERPRLNPKDVPVVVEKLKALPQAVKVRALLRDPTMMVLLAGSFGSGLLFMLGVFIEGYRSWGCEMHCLR